MNRVVVKSKVDRDGVVRVDVPVGKEEADREVEVTVEEARSTAMTQEEWRRRVLATAGKWQGDLERPPQGELEEREPLS